MRRRWGTALASVVLGWAVAWAAALEVPADAEVLLTDAGSRIVGVGRTIGGTHFELVLADGFAGPAVLVWLRPDGEVASLEVVVRDHAVWVEGQDLRTLLPASFVEVSVVPASAADRPGAGGARGVDAPPGLDRAPRGPPDDVPQGPPDDVPQGPPDDVPRGSSQEAPGTEGAGPPASPPGQDRSRGGERP